MTLFFQTLITALLTATKALDCASTLLKLSTQTEGNPIASRLMKKLGFKTTVFLDFFVETTLFVLLGMTLPPVLFCTLGLAYAYIQLRVAEFNWTGNTSWVTSLVWKGFSLMPFRRKQTPIKVMYDDQPIAHCATCRASIYKSDAGLCWRCTEPEEYLAAIGVQQGSRWSSRNGSPYVRTKPALTGPTSSPSTTIRVSPAQSSTRISPQFKNSSLF